MRRTGFGLAIALTMLSLCAPGRATAQIQIGMPGDTAILDSLSRSYLDALVEVRDTLTTLAANVSMFRQGLAGVGAETVLNQAEVLHGACVGSVAVLRAVEPVFRPSRAPNDRVRDESEALLREMRSLRRTLDEHCLTGMAVEGPGEWADSLRAWGPYHLRDIGLSVQAYHAASGLFQKAAEIKVRPRLPS